MADFSISGRLAVKALKKQFEDEFIRKGKIVKAESFRYGGNILVGKL